MTTSAYSEVIGSASATRVSPYCVAASQKYSVMLPMHTPSTGIIMPSSFPTTMSRSRTGDASSGISVPFSFSWVKVEAMSATPESAGNTALWKARPKSAASVMRDPRAVSTSASGRIAKMPMRTIALRSPRISQRISRHAMRTAFLISASPAPRSRSTHPRASAPRARA